MDKLFFKEFKKMIIGINPFDIAVVNTVRKA